MPCEAHAKWFVESEAAHGVVAPYSLSEDSVQVWVAILAVMLVAAAVIERQRVVELPAWLCFRTAPFPAALRRLAQMALGVSLFVLAVRGCLIAPSQGDGHADVYWLLLFAQAGTGCMLIADEVPGVAAATIAVLAVAAGASNGLASLFEASHVLALGAYFVLALDQRYADRALWLLRIGLGMSFCAAAFTEKLLAPSITARFLAHVDMNFMKHLGFDYSDRLFILSAGMSELLLGLLLVAGLVSRAAACALVIFLLASNGYLLAIGAHDDALTELVGHAPILAALFVIALHGSGAWRARKDREEALPAHPVHAKTLPLGVVEPANGRPLPRRTAS